MANQEQLDILKQGAQAWNQWRKEHPDIHPDLSDTDLMSADLSDVDLSQADLSGADLIFADLSGTDLRGADLSGTNLSFADLSGHNLSFVDLSGAFLGEADLSGAILNGANFSEAVIESTSFGDVDLSVVKNLETATHRGPSTIGIDTIYLSQGKIPEVFLRKAGVPDSFIEYMRSLVSNPIEYYSCFISYSSKDEDLAKRLYADLQSNHVRCWFAPEDLKIGAKIRTSIDDSIRLHDKLLLILSQYSVASQWIEQ